MQALKFGIRNEQMRYAQGGKLLLPQFRSGVAAKNRIQLGPLKADGENRECATTFLEFPQDQDPVVKRIQMFVRIIECGP